jgi:hypothetical protein
MYVQNVYLRLAEENFLTGDNFSHELSLPFIRRIPLRQFHQCSDWSFKLYKYKKITLPGRKARVLSLTISKSFRHRSNPSHANNISSVSSVTTFRLKFDVIWNIQSSFYCINQCSNKLSADLELSITCYLHSIYRIRFVSSYLFFTFLFDSIFHPNSSSSILVSLRMLPMPIL